MMIYCIQVIAFLSIVLLHDATIRAVDILLHNGMIGFALLRIRHPYFLIIIYVERKHLIKHNSQDFECVDAHINISFESHKFQLYIVR